MECLMRTELPISNRYTHTNTRAKLNIFHIAHLDKRSHSIRNWSMRSLCALTILCDMVQSTALYFYCRWEYRQLSWEIQMATKDCLCRFSQWRNFCCCCCLYDFFLFVRSFFLHNAVQISRGIQSDATISIWILSIWPYRMWGEQRKAAIFKSFIS